MSRDCPIAVICPLHFKTINIVFLFSTTQFNNTCFFNEAKYQFVSDALHYWHPQSFSCCRTLPHQVVGNRLNGPPTCAKIKLKPRNKGKICIHIIIFKLFVLIPITPPVLVSLIISIRNSFDSDQSHMKSCVFGMGLFRKYTKLIQCIPACDIRRT